MPKVLVIGASGLLGKEVVGVLKPSMDVIEAGLTRTPLRVDMTQPASLQELFARAGTVDAIVCTAGAAPFGPLAALSEHDWAAGLHSKLQGQVNVVSLGATMVRPGGSITLTTGVLAQTPIPSSAIVSTVNAGLEGFIRAAALELPEIRINAVSPGWVSETLQAMGMDPKRGMPAREVAQHYWHQITQGETASIRVAAA